ncbi:unnamed protein product [Closterium sp. NIES-54]
MATQKERSSSNDSPGTTPTPPPASGLQTEEGTATRPRATSSETPANQAAAFDPDMMEKFFSFMSFYEQHQQGAPAQSNNSNNNATPMSLNGSSYARGNQQQRPTFAPYEPQRGSVSFMPHPQPASGQERTLDALQVQSQFAHVLKLQTTKPFDGKDFFTWSFEFELMMEGAQILDFFDGSLPYPTHGTQDNIGSSRDNIGSSRDNIGSSKDNIGSSRNNIGSSRNNSSSSSSSSSNIDTNRCRAALPEPSRAARTGPSCPTCLWGAPTAITLTTAMASPPVLAFDAEGRPVKFETWLDDLHLFLQLTAKEDISLYDHALGHATAPAATADSTAHSQWQTRDAHARFAIRNSLPIDEREHFGQHKTAQALYTAVVARYSSPASAALGRLSLPYLFPDLASFHSVADLITHLRTSEARFRAAMPDEFLAKNPPPLWLTLYHLVTCLPDTLRSVRDHFLARCPTELTIALLEKELLAAEASIVAVGASRGDPRTPFFEGCSPSPLLPSVASAAAVHLLGTEKVGTARAACTGPSRPTCLWGAPTAFPPTAAITLTTPMASPPVLAFDVEGGGQGQQRASSTLRRPRRSVSGTLSTGGGGGFSCTYVIRTGDRIGQPCGGPHATQRCFARLNDAWRVQFPQATELPRWVDLLKKGIDIYALDFDAILTAMYVMSTSGEGAEYLCVPPDLGIRTSASAAPGTRVSATPGAGEAAALGACASAPLGTESTAALHTFILDSSASRCFFRDRTALEPLARPVAVSLADPSGGPVIATSSTVLPCPAVPSGTLSGLHLPSFSTNLVAGSALQDGGVHQFTPAYERVTHCTCARTGRHLATFTRQLGSDLYTLTTESPQVAASASASASGQLSAPCSCRSLAHETVLWHHRLGHPSVQRLRAMHSRYLVSGLPSVLPPLPPSPAPPCLPCVEGRQRAAPHSSFPPTTAPLQTLHMDVWGPAHVCGQGQERYFLIVVDDYSRYTTVFPLRTKGEVPDVLIPWIRRARLQLSERFHSDFPVLRVHSDRGGEFSSDLLAAYCAEHGIEQSFTLPASPQQNGQLHSPDIPTPRSYAEAIAGEYSSQWQSAMDAEMASWKSTGTYVDEVPPHGANIVSGMWIFRVKRPPGSPPVFKARYVARGFSQREGVDFFQTFSPTPKMTTLRVLLHVAAQRDYELSESQPLDHWDKRASFLQGSLHEEIWLRRPPGFTGSFPPGTQWSLRRPVYGLRQAPREWHGTLRTTLAALGFSSSTADPSLFLRTDPSLPPFYILVYVDDLVFATADTEAVAHVKLELQKRHTCTDLGELTSYLGLRITRDRARRTITLTQSHMVQQVLQRFGFTWSSAQATPLAIGHSLSALPSDESVEPSGPYPELIGCLMYLMTCTRPDLAYPLGLLARYVAPGRHRKVHWDAAKRVLRYLCSTSGMGLVLGGRHSVVLTGHSDASWVDDQATQRSSQGYTFSLGSGSVSWRSTRSSSVLSSSCVRD